MDFFLLQPCANPFSRYREYKRSRGMSPFPDIIGWLGGYPYEVAKPDAVVDFFRRRGFDVIKVKTVGRKLGNNEFVFRKNLE